MTPTTPAEAQAQGWTSLSVGCPTCRVEKAVPLNRLPRGERFSEMAQRMACKACGSRPDAMALSGAEGERLGLERFDETGERPQG